MQNQFLDPEPAPAFNSGAPASQSQAENADTEQNALEQNALEQDIAEQETVATPTETYAVTTMLAATQRKIRRRKRRFWGAFTLTEGTIALFVSGIQLLRHTDNDRAFVILLLLLPVALIALVVMVRTMQSPMDFDHEELTRAGGVRAIPALIDSLSSGRTPSSRKDVYNALTHLLPQMQATDANLLTARRRRMLNMLLKLESRPKWWSIEQTETAFTLAILKAYEQVGDPKAVPVVRKLANMRARTPRQRAIQQAAIECLPLLQSHAMPLDQNQTLLRAASQSKAAAEVLLRPAAESVDVPAEELLRAGPSETP